MKLSPFACVHTCLLNVVLGTFVAFICRHLFHKSCVDPWLLDHRTCPMCKMNILKALGIAVSLLVFHLFNKQFLRGFFAMKTKSLLHEVVFEMGNST